MFPSLSNLKKDIDKRSECLIFGFIHEAQKLLANDKSYFNITDLITFVIASFYFIKNEWDRELTSDFYQIEDDCLSIIKFENGSTNAYINGVIDKGIHSWKFKVEKYVLETDNYLDFLIGVVDQNHSLRYCPVNQQNRYFVGSKAYKGGYSRYGKILRQDDIIEMIINMDDKSLKYIINGIDYGKACSLQENAKYRAAIYMFCVSNKLRILHV